MKATHFIAALLGAICASAGTYLYMQGSLPSTSSSQNEQDQHSISLNAPKDGLISSASKVNPSNGVRSMVYDFNSNEDQLIQVDVAGILPAQITILQRGYVVERSLAEECGTMSCRDQAADAPSLVFKARENTDYQVVISGVDDRSYGPYQLSVNAMQPHDGTPLVVGETVSDWALGQTNNYPLVITEPGIYRIDMIARNPQLDGYLQIKANGKELVSDDDSGNQLDPQIRYYFEPGNYTIYASSAIGRENFKGGYQIALNKETLDLSALDLPPLGGELTFSETAQQGMYLQKEQRFSFQLAEPQIISVRIDSEQIDANLHVGPYSTQLHNNENAAELRVALAAGEHELIIDGDKQVGTFELTASSEAVPNHFIAPTLKPGEPKHINLRTRVDAISLPLTISHAGQYRIYMESDHLDAYLLLQQGLSTLAKDDDSGGDLDALIHAWLEPGEYEVIATAIGGLPLPAQFTVLVE